MKLKFTHVISIFIIAVILINTILAEHSVFTHANTIVSPSKSWGIFFNTQGDIEFTINHSGFAVMILAPREFLEGHLENDTSFLNSTITNDYYYYKVLDLAIHFPYKDYDPYRIEIHNASAPGGYGMFNPPQKIIFKNSILARKSGIRT